ncbi:MAG TPA: VTT domain-containing protein [Nocardioidaceae bacterium]|nr:VTT domain-containing protein [Nocardioidaceae bacterium]
MTSVLQYPALLGGLLDPQRLLAHFGAYALWGAALIVFIECWLFPFLPGDSLMFTVGLLIAAQQRVIQPIWVACIVLSATAVLSNVVGYWVGARLGPPIFDRPDSRFFKRRYVDQTNAFFDRYGNKAIFLARFVPIVRTFITLAAGVGQMSFRRFITYSAVGGVIWATGVTLLGYWLGRAAFIRSNIEAILVILVLISVVPIVVEALRVRARRRLSAPAEPDQRADAPSALDDA